MPTQFRDLLVWRRGMELAQLCSEIEASQAPGDPFVEQLRAAAIEVPAQVAAGHASDQLERYRTAVDEAGVAAARVACLLEIAESMAFVPRGDARVARGLELTGDIARLLATLMSSLRSR